MKRKLKYHLCSSVLSFDFFCFLYILVKRSYSLEKEGVFITLCYILGKEIIWFLSKFVSWLLLVLSSFLQVSSEEISGPRWLGPDDDGAGADMRFIRLQLRPDLRPGITASMRVDGTIEVEEVWLMGCLRREASRNPRVSRFCLGIGPYLGWVLFGFGCNGLIDFGPKV